MFKFVQKDHIYIKDYGYEYAVVESDALIYLEVKSWQNNTAREEIQ